MDGVRSVQYGRLLIVAFVLATAGCGSDGTAGDEAQNADARLEILELRGWIDAELPHELVAQIPLDAERVCLATGAVERQHQLPGRVFAMGVFSNVELQVGETRFEAALRLGRHGQSCSFERSRW